MTDAGLKKILGLALRNKKVIGTLLGRFEADDIEHGLLAIPQEVLNRDLKMLIMEQASDFLNDYQVFFENGSIYLDLNLTVSQLGRVNAKYMLIIDRFVFNQQEHSLSCFFKEDVKSEGNFVQSMALKAAGLKGSYLQTAVEFGKLDFIQASKDNVAINLDKLDFMEKIPPNLQLDYVSCENGLLKFKFSLFE